MKKRDGILRLKYRLEPKENDIVEFQILKQDSELLLSKGKSFEWTIKSIHCPAICVRTGTIFLRGILWSYDVSTICFQGHHLIPSIHKALELFIKSKFGNCKVVKS
jgi:hypothetical protein